MWIQVGGLVRVCVCVCVCVWGRVAFRWTGGCVASWLVRWLEWAGGVNIDATLWFCFMIVNPRQI